MKLLNIELWVNKILMELIVCFVKMRNSVTTLLILTALKNVESLNIKYVRNSTIPLMFVMVVQKDNIVNYKNFFHRANEAQKDYEEMLSTSREGIRIPEEDIKQI